MIDYWIESSEILFNGPEISLSPHLKICNFILKIFLRISSPELRRSQPELRGLVLKHIYSYFPFGCKQNTRDHQVFSIISSRS
jgi:hypothetical protein